MSVSPDAPFLRTLAPLLRGLERQFRGWLDGRHLWPVSLVQRAEMEGLADDVTRKTAALDVDQPILVVMLMGGTGVGKSTLLNALAGSAIAAASFTRPTTRDPVVYHHHSIPPERLDPALRSCRLVSHDREALAHKVLVDTPDVDSNDLANRDKLIALLPVADIVLYVGSQEKYHDQLGWELFKAQRQRRAFAFVLNKWDRCTDTGENGIRPDADLLRDLTAEGFANPRLFRTTAQLWLDAANQDLTSPANLPAGEQFAALVDWLEQGLTRREIEAVKARGVLQLLAQANSTVASVRPPDLSGEAERVIASWPAVLHEEAKVAAEVLVNSLDPHRVELEHHFTVHGRQRFRGLMAGWLKLTTHVRTLGASFRPRISLGSKSDDNAVSDLDFAALSEESTLTACERILKPRAQALTNRLVVDADQKGFPIALLNEKTTAVQGPEWPRKLSSAVSETLAEVERECTQPGGSKAALQWLVTLLANYLPETALLASIGIVLWKLTVELNTPSFAFMLMPVYVTVGILVLLHLLVSIVFPVRWAALREDFRKRLERRLADDYERSYLPLPAEVATLVASERTTVETLMKEVQEVKTWLDDIETAANVSELYGR
ncbi:hypothetical protein BH11PLA2_BH11PLA2_10510 [soil metagenome]